MKVIHHGARKPVAAADLLPLPGPRAGRAPLTPSRSSQETSPQPGARLRLPKGNKGGVVNVVRRHLSPQPPRRLESLEAAWSAGGAPRSPERRSGDPEEGRPGGAPRSRKKGFKPPDVRTIFTPGEKDPRVKEESGEGHSFGAGGEGTWCDVCCKYIFQKGLTCAGCKYACHAACRSHVSLDCHPAAAAVAPPTLPITQMQLNNNNDNNNQTPPSHDVDKESKLRTEFSREEIRQKIEQYNTKTRDHLKMTLGSNGVYTGFVKVQMDLRRPVTVRAGRRVTSAAAVAGEAFYLPRGVSNTLHISSHNTVRQVIVALLNKFTVADNPAKYALYKRYRREEQVYVCKLSDGEQPLFLRLVAGPDDDTLGFVLREQQTGEVLWDAFSVPELRNFLRILDKEEEEQKGALLRRYDVYRHRLKEALREVRACSGAAQ
ncbi:ras association domain-containing protein 5 isoform X1 [Syngnathus acus]|uniref:ras association domain-containing protein 5 isoform X1 n=1 Tax=Syngnathus acus TaxID=161584 RepID=UPI00188626F8|nr:ras association domain-containing protein 5 isoform X1 [Syngnathus acus]